LSEPTEDTEEVILTRWEKLKNWFDILKTSFTIGKILWGFLFVSAGAVVVGEATDTSPVRDVAEYTGIVQPDTTMAGLLARIDALDETVEQQNATLERLQEHQHNYPEPEVITGPAGKDGKDGLNGRDGKDGRDGRDGQDSAPAAQIDSALDAHISDDH
jgi:hypothetical protein